MSFNKSGKQIGPAGLEKIRTNCNHIELTVSLFLSFVFSGAFFWRTWILVVAERLFFFFFGLVPRDGVATVVVVASGVVVEVIVVGC